jgi:hypothetical protein
VQRRLREEPNTKPHPLDTWQDNSPTFTPTAARAGAARPKVLAARPTAAAPKTDFFEHVDMLPSVQTEQNGKNRQKNGNHGHDKRQISVIMQLAEL